MSDDRPPAQRGIGGRRAIVSVDGDGQSDSSLDRRDPGPRTTLQPRRRLPVLDRVLIYRLLLSQHGPQHWWPSESAFETMVGAILVQATGWGNAATAIERLRSAGLLDPTRMRAEPIESLAEHIRPSGYYRAKARKLHAMCRYLEWYNDDPSRIADEPADKLRAELLEVHGIGEETADAILLYVAGVPTFVVDAYTRRLLKRLGAPAADEGYAELQAWMLGGLPADADMLGEYHALIVRHGRDVCVKREPHCVICSLTHICPYPAEAQSSSR